MWMYDLTGGLRIGKLHKRISKEEALQYMPTLPADNVAALDPQVDAFIDASGAPPAVISGIKAVGPAGLDEGEPAECRVGLGRCLVPFAQTISRLACIHIDDVAPQVVLPEDGEIAPPPLRIFADYRWPAIIGEQQIAQLAYVAEEL